MAIDLQKLEQKFNALLDDPNFVTDFEQWLEARNVSQNSSKPIVISSALSGISCTARNCTKPAVGDYNGHGDYACQYHMDKWNDEFDDEYR